MFCHDGLDPMHVVWCALDYLSAEYSTVNAGLGRPVFWKAQNLNRLSRKRV